jgi:methyl-accepting chemotaxis protein
MTPTVTASPRERAPRAAAPAAKVRLTEKFGIDEATLATRREFIRLGERERQLLIKLIPWADKVAEAVAKEFYDWQFAFGPTRDWFERFVSGRGMPIATLRRTLEQAQAGYFKAIFHGARDSWGVDYFENRLNIGMIHDRINLPFKWYIGSYAEFWRLVPKYLKGTLKTPGAIQEATEAVIKVMNYDIQAVGDSFIMSTLESMGMSVEDVEAARGADRTEHLDQVKDQVATLLRQAHAIAEKRLSDESLAQSVTGQLGSAFSAMVANLRDFVDAVGRNAQALASASEELTAVSQQMSGNAEETSAQANVVSAAAEQVSKNIQTVSAAAEEMSASIKEIAKNASDAARVATAAVTITENTNATVGKLGESSMEIGKVIKVITSIAEQTNLLALNATIEAARAGEAGKGFAVVANEVKELAKETARATEDISRKIETIQNDTRASVEAIGQISGTINQINDIQSTIASAVEEQTATTNEIGRNVSEAAKGSAEIAKNITGVAQAAQSTAGGASDSQRAASELATMSAELQRLVAQFV